MQNTYLLTPAETAEFLHVCDRTLVRWRNRRIGPSWTMVGGKVAYQMKDLQAWLDAQRVEPVRDREAA